MAELPKSWGLKKVKRADGKLDIVGKDDNGHDYKVRTTDGPSVTDRDVTELRAADREAYSDRETGVRTFVKNLVTEGKAKKQSQSEAFGDEMAEAAGPVAYALMDRKGASAPFSGSTSRFRAAWERNPPFGGD